MSNDSQDRPKINNEQRSWEDIPCPPPPRAAYGKDDMLHLTTREFHSNAMNFFARNTFTWMMVFPDFDGGTPSKWLVCASDAKPFKDINEISTKGCEPNKSALVGDSLQGFGLLFQALLLSSRAPSLVVASMCEDGQFSAVYANENQDTRLTLDRRVASEWAFKVLDYKFGDDRWGKDGFAAKSAGGRAKIRWFDKWSVICMFRLPDDTPDNRWTIGDRLMCLPWATGDDYIHSATDVGTGMSAGYCEKVLQLSDKFVPNTGNHSRKILSREEYIDRFRGDDALFDIPTEGTAELPMQGEGVEDIVIKGRIKVHHFPVKVRPKKGESGNGGGWLENLRDIPGRAAVKGAGGHGGKKLSQKVLGLFSALYDDRPGFRRFKNQAVYFGGADPAPFLREMGLPETYRLGNWFFVIEIDIQEVRDKDGKQFNALQVSKCLNRVSNQTFGDKDAFRQILLCAMRNVSHDEPERLRLSDYIREKYPSKESGFPEINLSLTYGDSGTDGIGNNPRWRVFDIITGERITNKIADPGELLRVAVFDTVSNAWCGHQISGDPHSFEIEDITNYISGRKFGVTDEMVAGIEKLEAISPGVHVFGITIHKLGKLDNGIWRPIELEEYTPNNREFRPGRTIRLLIGNEIQPEFVKVCKVRVPTPDRPASPGESRRRGIGGGGGRKDKSVTPVCWRDKGFFCRWDPTAGVDGYLLLNGNDLWVEHYIGNTIDQTRNYAKDIIEYLNRHAEALVKPMENYRLRADDDLVSAPSEEGWGKDNMDIVLNLYLRTILDDDYIKTRVDKISKVFARLEETDVEYVRYAAAPAKKNEIAKEENA